ncbi:MAG TPA: Calx-beta domain-containing protein [Gemmatimonadaceae bacterium]|nr:Calx-beta domain-containing protein [Gemmatimonadaceae bacterium]
MRLPSGRTLARYACGVVALAFAGATCKDLTGPTGLATGGGQVTVTYMGARGPSGAVELTAGQRVSPPVDIRIGGTPVTRARYVFSTRDTSLTGSADTIITVNRTADTLIAKDRGRAKIIVTLVGATVGGKLNPGDKIADTVDVFVIPANNVVVAPRTTLTSLNETLPLTAFSTDGSGTRTKRGRVDWTSSDPSVITVDPLGTNAADSNVTVVTAVGNGTATITALFDSVRTKTTTITVQQRLFKYRLTSPAVVNGEIILKSLHDSVVVTATPFDSIGSQLTTGSATPTAPTFISSIPDRAPVNAVSGLVEALLNTDVAAPAIVYANVNGVAQSDTIRVRVQQEAISLSIIGKRVDTIPSIGATKDLSAIVKDARNNDVQTGITWLSRNTAIARYQSTPTDQAFAIDTGSTWFVAQRDLVKDSIQVSVTNNPETVILSPDTLYLRSVNEVKRFTDVVLKNTKGDRLTSGIPITWSSSNTSVVQARADSTMLAAGIGAADVTAATPNGKSATAHVVVTNAPASIDIVPTDTTVASVGDTLVNLPTTITNGLGATLPRGSANWSSDNPAIANVAVDANNNVFVVATGSGIARIHATSPIDPLVTDVIVVTVTNAATSITVSPSPPPTITSLNGTVPFTATVLNSAGRPIAGAQVTWSVLAGGTGVLAIDPVTGIAQVLANGSATVRATSGSVTTDVPVTVAQVISGTRSTIVPGVATLVANGTNSTSITVQLKDANDNNIAFGGSSVVLATSLGTLGAVTDAGNGRYTATLTTGTASGAATISGTVAGSAITNNAIVSFTAGTAAKYLVTPTNLTPTAGSAVTVRAQVADGNNNPVAISGNVVQFTSTNGGSFTPVNGRATTNASGLATITFTTNATASSHTITATTGAITGASAAIVSVPGTVAGVLVSASTTSPTAGSVVTITAQLRDANGNDVAQQGVSVAWSKSNANGSFPGGATDASTTNASGVATIAFTTHTVAGTATTVTGTIGAISGTSPTITTSAGAASQIALNAGNAQSAATGTSVAIAPSVIVRDAQNNPVAGVTVTFAVASGGGSGTGLLALTNASGVATAGSWTLGSAIGPNTMTATVPGLAGSPVTFSATATGTAALSVTQNGSESGPTSIVYTVSLSAPNTTGAPITFTVANSGGTATSGTDFTAFGGAAAISVANGASTGTLSVGVLADASIEGTETVQATISSPSSAAVSITGATATANIVEAGATAALSVTTQGVEGGANIVYTVTLSSANNTGAPITFAVANSGGTATSGSDFTAFGGAAAISIANGASSGTLTVTVTNDALVESTETVQATISSPSNATVSISTASATATITDNDAANAVLSVSTNGNETGPVALVYTVTLSATNATGAPITFDVANSGGSATSGADFTAFGGVAAIRVANGASTGTLTVPVTNDAAVEATETVQATISNASNAAVTITGASATASIVDNDGAAATLSVTQNGSEAGQSIVFTVTLSSANTSGAPITFDVANSGGTAVSGSDFTAFGGVAALSIANNASSASLTVPVTNDAVVEGTETVQATISNPSNAAISIAGATATASIFDNDGATASLSVTTQGAEAAVPTSIVYTVTLSSANNTGGPITFDVAHSGGTATSGSDFTAFGGLAAISVANGSSSGTLTVPVTDDALLEGAETVQATISNPSNPQITITTASATATITDNETATASIAATTQGDETGPVAIVYTVTLSSTNNTGAPITFDVANSGGTATSGFDFTAFGGVAAVSIPNGGSTGTFSVTVANDALVEGTETVQATIGNPSNAAVTVSGATATATIADNDGATASLSVAQNGSESGPTNIVFTVTLSSANNSGAPLSFDVSNSGGSATSGSDFTAFGGAAAITIPNGATTGSLTVAVLNDAVFEPVETVQATISNPSNASVSIAVPTATANIVDNETASASLAVTTQGSEAGPTSIVYTVTLSTTNNTGAPITFDVTNSGGSATSGSDFAAFGGSAAISVANGASSATLTVPVSNDALLESAETVQATISNPSNSAVSIITATATATIADNDAATAALSVTTQGTEAGPVAIVYTVTLSAANNTSAPISFDVSNSGGTATSGVDYSAFGGAGAISVPVGATTGTLSVPVTNDATVETTETVQATISNPSNAAITISGASATANISDNDGASASLSVTQHGSEPGTNIVFTVTLSTANNTGAPITFDVVNSGGSATSGSDFTAFGGVAAISVADGATTGSLTVTVLNDAIFEPVETVQATISNPSNASVTIAGATATANITDNDGPSATLTVTTPGAEAGPTNIVYTVTLSTANNTGAPITFDVSNSGGSATSGSDFTAFGGVGAISVANGASTGTLTVTVANDALLESTETVQATISNPSNGAVSIAGATATATISDNDAANAALSVTTAGSETGPTSIVYTVTLSAANNTAAPITFDVANSGGTATSGLDFTAFGATGAIAVPVGSTTGTLTVPVTDDGVVEVTETVQATISNPSNAAVTITGATATANITDNDAATATLSVTQHGSEAGPTSIVYTVTLSSPNATGAPVTFDVTNSGGTATSGSDFTAFGGAAAISIANGASTGSLTVPVTNDALMEGTETVQATISNPSSASVSIAGATATANILDNDGSSAVLSVTTNGAEAASPTNVVYMVTLSAANNTGAPITFDVANSGGTAVAGTDFTAFAGAAAVSVANGSSTGTLTVTVLDDALLDGTRTVQATISNASTPQVTITTPSATASISDNESATAALSVTTPGSETGPTSIVYTVTLSSVNNTGAAVTFDVANSGGTATSGSDFTAFGGTAAISVANGASTGILTVPVTNDAVIEGTETVLATISNPSLGAVSITTPTASATIADNDGATAALSVTTNGNESGPVAIVYTVTLSAANNSGAPITFDMANSGGSATSGSDFAPFGGVAAITVPNGATTGTLSVAVIDDGGIEPTETVQATISNPSNASVSITTASATANITDNDAASATLSVTQHGSEAGPTNVVYTVTLSATNSTGAPITFDVANSGGTAVAGTDFTAFGGAAAIAVANGSSTGTLTVTVLNDALLDGTRTVQATISNPSNAGVSISGASATANIVDNETTTAALSVSTQGAEGGTNIVYSVTLGTTNSTGAPITFDVANSGGSATSGSDFTAFGGSAAISVANGSSTGTLTVNVTDDALLESTETVQATISNASLAAVTISTPSATANITDNESANASIAVTSNGSEAGPLNIVYTVTLSRTNNTGAPITFTVASSGSATSGSDYTAFAGAAAVSVPDGASTGTLTVSVLDDALLEGTETVGATISAPSNAAVTITGATATANLADNESSTASLSVTTPGAEAAVPTNVVYTVTLSAPNNTGSAITFDIANSGGTAVAGTDFTAFGGAAAITVANGSSTGTLTVAVLNDALLDGTRTVQATISNPSNPAVSIVGATATANITDNETATAALSVTTQGAEAGPTNIVYTVTLSATNNTGAPITFDVTNSGGTATSGSDFTPFGGAAAISVANGATTGTLTVAVVNDALLEGTETVQATLSNPSLGAALTFTAATATANITDNETATAALSVTQNGNEAGPTNIVYTVTLNAVNNSGAPITFDVANSGGSATSGSDFTAFGGTAAISVPVGSSTGSLSVTVTNDALLEATETVDATISNANNAAVSITGATATANIVDNETATASIAVTTQGAEAATPTNVVYTVTLSKINDTGAPITFDVANSGGTGISGTDFTAFGGSAAVSVGTGVATGTLTVAVLNDNLLDGTRTVQATISNPSHAGVSVATASATANITDNETATASIAATQDGNESGLVSVQYTVTLTSTNNTGAPITFAVASGGTATAGSDYAAFAGAAAVSVPDGSSTGTLTVAVLNDALLENTETVQATISSPSLASVTVPGAGSSATANLLEEGATATLSATQSGAEATTSTNIVYTVTLNKTNATGGAITFTTADNGTGSATSGSDYTAFGGAAGVSIANGASSGTFSVAVLNDALLESTETVVARITTPSSGSVAISGAGTASASIVDNETATAVLSVTQNGSEVGATTPIIYTVTLNRTNNTGAPITFVVSNSGGTATSGSDFTAFGATPISVPNGQSTGTLTVPVTDDALLESTETVEASISDPSLASVTVTTPTATANIVESGAIATLSATSPSEGNDIVFTVTLNKQNVTGSDIDFTFARLGSSTATAADYGAVPVKITVANTATAGSANLTTTDDALLENDETFDAQVSSPTNPKVAFSAGSDLATATIAETGATATLSATSPTEGTDVVFTVTLNKQNVTGADIDFTFAKAGGTTDASDYGLVPTTITVANTQSNGTANLTTVDDALLENNETFDAQISGPTNGDVTFSSGSDVTTATIVESGATVELTVQTNGAEPATDVVYKVELMHNGIAKTNVTGNDILIDYSDQTVAQGGTATAGSDYTAFGATATITNTSSSTTFTVSVLDDVVAEPTPETVIARLAINTAPATVTIGTGQATATITSDE